MLLYKIVVQMYVYAGKFGTNGLSKKRKVYISVQMGYNTQNELLSFFFYVNGQCPINANVRFKFNKIKFLKTVYPRIVLCLRLYIFFLPLNVTKI